MYFGLSSLILRGSIIYSPTDGADAHRIIHILASIFSIGQFFGTS